MRKVIFLLLALVLPACAPVTPIIIAPEIPASPTPTPGMIVQTMIVTVIVTSISTNIPLATATPPSLQMLGQTTKQVEPVSPVSSPAVATGEIADSSPITLDHTLGGSWFSTITLTGTALSMRCDANKQIIFKVTPSTPNITKADFYYRIEDRGSGLIFDWEGPRRMNLDQNGSFRLVFTGEDVKPNLRFKNAWFDFQFVGLDESGGHVGNSEKIVQQVSYTFDCP